MSLSEEKKLENIVQLINETSNQVFEELGSRVNYSIGINIDVSISFSEHHSRIDTRNVYDCK